MPALTHLARACAALALPWLATAASAQIVAQPPIQLQPVEPPTIPVPDGYGRYCSMTWADGSWALGALPAKDSDPCGDMQKQRAGGTIQRAGLWNTAGNNNAMVRCNQGIWLYRDANDTAILNAYNSVKNRTDLNNCIFTIAPTRLPIFGLPWSGVTPSLPNRFNYNIYAWIGAAKGGQYWNVADFGQVPDAGHPLASNVDRKGRQMGYPGTAAECAAANKPAGCLINKAGSIGEGAYDFRMPWGSKLVAVAPGIVRVRRDRAVPGCKDPTQPEVYIEHKVGDGVYAERFVTYYAHMSSIGSDIVTGKVLAQGGAIGGVGDLGCSSPNAPHLHIGVFRTTNLSGHRSLPLSFPTSGYGVSSISGAIDPFGWSASNIDPWAYRYLNGVTDPYLGQVAAPGAFSMLLWKPDSVPPFD